MRGGINSTNIFRIVWEKLPNPDIDSDGSEDTKSHSSFSGLSVQLLRLIRQLRVLESYLGTSWHKVTFRVASTREEALDNKEVVMLDFNAQRSTSERKEVFVIKWRVRSYLQSSWERRHDMEKFDSTDTTSKRNVRRYVQAQEALFGIKRKRIVDKQHP